MKKRSAAKRDRIKRRFRSAAAGVIVFLCACATFGCVFLVSAHEKSAESDFLSACYRSIEIQPGDTLWDIAEETMPSGYDSTAEYVEALKDMNGLTTDLIRAGEHLIIAYEDTEFIP